MANRRIYGLTGYPLSHSFSQKYFTEKFDQEQIRDCEYRPFPLKDVSAVRDLVRSEPSLCGLNVTIPHKQTVMQYLDDLEPEAKEIGAVNVIQIERRKDDVFLKGCNSDVYGFTTSLTPLLPAEYNSLKALVLGTGGASKSVLYALRSLGIACSVVSRKPGAQVFKTYRQITPDDIAEHLLIVNCTPLGMFPRTETVPLLPYPSLTPHHILFDLVYNPEETTFLKWGRTFGAKTKNGMEMLQLQAERAWQMWNQGV